MGAICALFLLAAAEDVTPVEPALPPAAPAPVAGSGKRAAIAGFITTAIAAGLAAATPAYSNGRSDVPLAFGISAFLLVGIVRPFAFFGSQSEKPPKSTARDALRVTGTTGAVLGLVTFIVGLVLRANQSPSSVWAMTATAGLETVSIGAFSADCLMSALH